jgi:hypothetical protein
MRDAARFGTETTAKEALAFVLLAFPSAGPTPGPAGAPQTVNVRFPLRMSAPPPHAAA